MLKAPMLVAAVLVVCVASSADARRRHHHGYYDYGERGQSTLDNWRRARDPQGQAQDRGQGQGQDQGQNQGQDQRQGQAQDQRQNQRQDRGQDRVQDFRRDRWRERGDRRRARSLDEWRRSRDTQSQGQESGRALARDRGEDRSRETYDRRRSRYDERRARYEDWRRSPEREDSSRPREAERGDAVMRPGRGGPFGAVVERLVRVCSQHGTDFDNWPFDALEQIAGTDEGRRTALAALRERAKKAAEKLAADCPKDMPAAPAARLEAVEQGIDATLAAFDQVQPALQSFYGALDDEQKARLYRDMMAAPAAAARETTPRREAQDERRESREYGSRRHRWRAYAAAREAAARDPTPRQTAPRPAAAPAWSAMCDEFAAVLRGWPVREIERDVRLSSPQRVAFYELVTASLKAADTLGGACPAESALTPVGRMDAMRKRLAAVRAATAAIRPALAHFYEALDQGQKVRFAGMS